MGSHFFFVLFLTLCGDLNPTATPTSDILVEHVRKGTAEMAKLFPLDPKHNTIYAYQGRSVCPMVANSVSFLRNLNFLWKESLTLTRFLESKFSMKGINRLMIIVLFAYVILFVSAIKYFSIDVQARIVDWYNNSSCFHILSYNLNYNQRVFCRLLIYFSAELRLMLIK